jgi:hypothetical protein
LKTVTLLFPSDVISVAGTVAVSWLLETNVVGSADPFHSTVDVGTKCEPDTVSVKAVPPRAAEVGEMPDKTGAGLVTVKVVDPLIAPNAASIVVVPPPMAVAKPCELEALLIVATLGAEELHVAVLVRFCVLPSP